MFGLSRLPQLTMTAGTGTSRFAKMASITMLNVRRKGQGKAGHKKPVLFPKLVFLYDERLHGPGGELEDVFEAGIACSAKTMSPDWLSLTGEGYIASMYKKYGKIISPMGCRAFLSPWYERGGMKPADEADVPVFVGRFNIGVVSLHLPMILAKARQESRDFYEVLDHYLELIRRIHIRTYAYLGEMRASTNPLAYCEGGFLGGHLKLTDKIHDGGVWADQGVIAGCAGGLFDNITEAADILRGGSTGNGAFTLDVYPTSVPVSLELTRIGATADLLATGAVIKPSFCGPCFGAGDVPANNGLSLRHTTRNFPNREGSKPAEGQFAGVCLMDARSIAATAANGGRITAATDIDYIPVHRDYHFDKGVYDRRLYYGFGKADPSVELVMGPNITDWPQMAPLAENLLVELAAVLRDPVTTTDELIPSGETSSYRSNPLRLAEFTLSRREPAYVGRAKAVAATEAERLAGNAPEKLTSLLDKVGDGASLLKTTQFGSCVFANKPGDGSAREQAASCQKVLGGFANICYEFATKRYRSNCINWGILPFTLDADTAFPYEAGDCVFVPGIRSAIENGAENISAKVIRVDGTVEDLMLHVRGLTEDEKEIILDGCLMNYYAKRTK